MDNLKTRIKELIIQSLGLDDVQAKDIHDDAPLFLSADEEGNGLGLDSVDSLEIIVAMKREFNLKITDENMNVMQSINTLAQFIENSASVIDVG